MRWADANNYEHVLKCDDDTFVALGRLLKSDYRAWNYSGRLRGPANEFPAPYCSGFAYWLSRKAMRIIAAAEIYPHKFEDQFVGSRLLEAGIQPHHDGRYVVIQSRRNTRSANEGPRHGNRVIAACEFENPQAMHKAAQDYAHAAATEFPGELRGEFSRIAIMVKTFLRDGYLYNSVYGMLKNLPGAQLIVVDDGRESHDKIPFQARLRNAGHVYEWLPFDSGFGAKSNRAVKLLERDYLLVASDDFDFQTPGITDAIRKMQAVLDGDPEIGVASGRVDGRAYEATLAFGKDQNGNFCRESSGYHSAKVSGGVGYLLCDLTVNFSLIRREVFKSVAWDNDIKIGGGEHGAFFIDVKRAGWRVAFVPGANVNQLHLSENQQDRHYSKFRARAAATPGRPCLKRRGIDVYYLMNGSAERC